MNNNMENKEEIVINNNINNLEKENYNYVISGKIIDLKKESVLNDNNIGFKNENNNEVLFEKDINKNKIKDNIEKDRDDKIENKKENIPHIKDTANKEIYDNFIINTNINHIKEEKEIQEKAITINKINKKYNIIINVDNEVNNNEMIKNNSEYNEINNKIEKNFINCDKNGNNNFKKIPEQCKIEISENIPHKRNKKIEINNPDNNGNSKDKFISENNQRKTIIKESKIVEVIRLDKKKLILIVILYILIGHYYIINNINLPKGKNSFISISILITFFLIEIPYLIIQIYFNLITLIIYAFKDGLSSYIHRFYYSIKNKKFESYRILVKLISFKT